MSKVFIHRNEITRTHCGLGTVRTPFSIFHFPFYFRQLLLCRVALGKSFLQFSAMKMAHAPPGHHSVIGRPSAGGLHFPEYVVYRGEQVSPILFSTHRNCDRIHIFPIHFPGISRVFGDISNCEARGQFQWQRGHGKVMDFKCHIEYNACGGDDTQTNHIDIDGARPQWHRIEIQSNQIESQIE